MMWTRFMDMNSGGRTKHKYEYIYIEADKEEAVRVFYNRFGTNPFRVSCTCCGEDYSIHSHESLEQATAFERGCRLDDKTKGYVEEPDTCYNKKYIGLDDHLKSNKALFIGAGDIQPEERVGDVPEQGYVWHD